MSWVKKGTIHRQKMTQWVINTLTFVIMFSILLTPIYGWADETPTANLVSSPEKLLTETLNAHQVKLNWVDMSPNEQGFTIVRATDRAFSQNQVSFDAAANDTIYIDETTEPLTIYYYKIRAFTAESESIWSNIAIVLTPDTIPSSPSDLYVSSPASFQVQLLWTDNSNNESGFRVDRSTNASFTEDLTGFIVGANVNKCLDSTTPGGNFYYRVVAFNYAGESSPSKPESLTVDSRTIEDSYLIGPVTADVATTGFAQYSMPFKVNSSGLVQGSDIPLTLGDQRGKVTFTKGTKMLNLNGHALTAISYNPSNIVPQPPDGKIILGAFGFGPNKATFDPALTMVLKYNPASVLPGVNLNNINVGSWDGNSWELISVSGVNTNTGEVTVKVNHFSLLAIMATKTQIPSAFSVSDLVVIPGYIVEGEKALVQVTAKNSGNIPGNYQLILTCNDEIEESRVVALEGGASYTETFQILDKKANNYKVNVNGLKKDFVVQALPTATTPSLTPISTNSITTTTTTAVAQPTFSTIEIPESNYVPTKPNMTLIIAIAGAMGLIIAGSLLFFFIRK